MHRVEMAAILGRLNCNLNQSALQQSRKSTAMWLLLSFPRSAGATGSNAGTLSTLPPGRPSPTTSPERAHWFKWLIREAVHSQPGFIEDSRSPETNGLNGAVPRREPLNASFDVP